MSNSHSEPRTVCPGRHDGSILVGSDLDSRQRRARIRCRPSVACQSGTATARVDSWGSGLYSRSGLWSHDDSLTRSPSNLAALAHCPYGALVGVAAFDLAETRNGRKVELISLERYDTGAVLSFRATGPTEVADEFISLTWICTLADEAGTGYTTVAIGEGHSGLWRGEVLIIPTPPDHARRLLVNLICLGREFHFVIAT